MKYLEKFFAMFAKLKDWRIALMMIIMFCFTMYCLFFGGIKQITNYFLQAKIRLKSKVLSLRK